MEDVWCCWESGFTMPALGLMMMLGALLRIGIALPSIRLPLLRAIAASLASGEMYLLTVDWFGYSFFPAAMSWGDM